jgi:hypothetical protein
MGSSSATTAKLITQVMDQRKQSKDDGNTLNLRNMGIAETLPAEVIEMIKDEVSRYYHLCTSLTEDWIWDKISCFTLIRSSRR